MTKNRIKELRESSNLTLKDLSDQVKKKTGVRISPDSLAKYERGERNPKIEKWQALADFFGVSVPYLQGVSDVSININKKVLDFITNHNIDLERFITVQSLFDDDAYKKIDEIVDRTKEGDKSAANALKEIKEEMNKYIHGIRHDSEK